MDIDIKKRNIVFVDLEFTGPEIKHEIIELGCVVVNQPNFEIIDKWQTRIRPEHIENASSESLSISGYDPELWKDSISLKDALLKFNEISQDCILAGFNFGWDWMFLKKSYCELNLKPSFGHRMVDVMSIAFAKLYNEDFREFSLEETCRYLKIERGKAHQAYDDAYATYLLFLELMKNEKI